MHGLEALDARTLLLIAPLVVMQLGLLIVAVRDLLRVDRSVRGGNKGLWALVIVFVSMVGPLLYFLVGRVDGPPPPDERDQPAPGYGSPHDAPLVGRRAPSDSERDRDRAR